MELDSTDRVVELAPGLGTTTRLILACRPLSYTGVERDARAVEFVGSLLTAPEHNCRVGTAQKTGLEDSSASVVVGEAFLSMQPEPAKQSIVDEVFRVLEPGGRYGLHELALRPDDLSVEQQDTIRSDLSSALRVGARPLTVTSWRALLEGAGFVVETERVVPMLLLSPKRLLDDEGVGRALRIVSGVLRSRRVRTRIRGIRAVFDRHADSMAAIVLTARKPDLGYSAERTYLNVARQGQG